MENKDKEILLKILKHAELHFISADLYSQFSTDPAVKTIHRVVDNTGICGRIRKAFRLTC